jgi:hypothetical protein
MIVIVSDIKLPSKRKNQQLQERKRKEPVERTRNITGNKKCLPLAWDPISQHQIFCRFC